MIAYLRLLLRSVWLFLLCAIVISFVLSNKTRVGIGLYPLPYEADLPLYALSALLLGSGFLIGLTLSSLRHTARHYRLRRRLRSEEAKSRALEQQLAATEIERQARQHYPPLPVGLVSNSADIRY